MKIYPTNISFTELINFNIFKHTKARKFIFKVFFLNSEDSVFVPPPSRDRFRPFLGVIMIIKYSVSCGLSAVTGQSVGPGTRPALIETD
jgi:hypothetical protein